jgi:hypothetical protein
LGAPSVVKSLAFSTGKSEDFGLFAEPRMARGGGRKKFKTALLAAVQGAQLSALTLSDFILKSPILMFFELYFEF